MEAMRKRIMAQNAQWAETPLNRPRHLTASSQLGAGSQSILPGTDIQERSRRPDGPEPASVAPEGASLLHQPHHATSDPSSAPSSAPRLLQRSSLTTQGWTLDGLIKKGRRFREVPRVSILDSPDVVRQALDKHEQDGIPLIMEECHEHPGWPAEIFTARWLMDNHGSDMLLARNIHDRSDKKMKLSEFIIQSRETPSLLSIEEGERLYGKDADCPAEWREWLQCSNVLHHGLLPCGSNDLLQYLPQDETVESLLCYFGIGDTFTPCHKDLCGSSGHNIMCYTENDGSSFWFMMASHDAPEVAEYFQSKLGQELDWETHATSVDELANAPFPVYVAEQKLGDLVLVPPRSCHQVVNSGGLTMKMSWSRMTVTGLATALHYELPIYRRVCRPEQYRIKSILYRSLLHYTHELETGLHKLYALSEGKDSNLEAESTPHPPSTSHRSSSPFDRNQASNQAKSLKSLLQLFDELLHEEFLKDYRSIPLISDNLSWGISVVSKNRLILQPPSSFHFRNGKEQGMEQSCTLACDFCGADIFQSFFECRKCLPPEASKPTRYGDGLLICSPCYIEGRSCLCGSMEPVQCRSFEILLRDRNKAAITLNYFQAGTSELGRKCMELTEGDFTKDNRIHIFEAACALHEHRRNSVDKIHDLRKCRSGAHRVPYLSVVTCGPCHGSKCFYHILQGGIHSAEAILALLRDKDQTYWHQLHKDARTAFVQGRPSLHGSKKVDGSLHLKDRLVSAAQQYRECKPIVESFTKRGWYDLNGLEISTGENEPDDNEAMTPAMPLQIGPPVMTNRRQTPRPDPDALGSPLTEIDESPSDHGGSPILLPSTMAANPTATSSMGVETFSSDVDASLIAPLAATRMDQRSARMWISHVLIPPMPSAYHGMKRAGSPVGEQSKKRMKRDGSLEPGIRRRLGENSKTRREDGAVAENYGEELANVMRNANQMRFGPPVSRRKPSRRRIMSPVSSDDSPVTSLSKSTRPFPVTVATTSYSSRLIMGATAMPQKTQPGPVSTSAKHVAKSQRTASAVFASPLPTSVPHHNPNPVVSPLRERSGRPPGIRISQMRVKRKQPLLSREEQTEVFQVNGPHTSQGFTFRKRETAMSSLDREKKKNEKLKEKLRDQHADFERRSSQLLAKHSEELDTMKNRLEEKSMRTKELELQINEKYALTKEKELLIREKDALIKEKDERMREQAKELQEKNKQLEELSAQLAAARSPNPLIDQLRHGLQGTVAEATARTSDGGLVDVGTREQVSSKLMTVEQPALEEALRQVFAAFSAWNQLSGSQGNQMQTQVPNSGHQFAAPLMSTGPSNESNPVDYMPNQRNRAAYGNVNRGMRHDPERTFSGRMQRPDGFYGGRPSGFNGHPKTMQWHKNFHDRNSHHGEPYFRPAQHHRGHPRPQFILGSSQSGPFPAQEREMVVNHYQELVPLDHQHQQLPHQGRYWDRNRQPHPRTENYDRPVISPHPVAHTAKEQHPTDDTGSSRPSDRDEHRLQSMQGNRSPTTYRRASSLPHPVQKHYSMYSPESEGCWEDEYARDDKEAERPDQAESVSLNVPVRHESPFAIDGRTVNDGEDGDEVSLEHHSVTSKPPHDLEGYGDSGR